MNEDVQPPEPNEPDAPGAEEPQASGAPETAPVEPVAETAEAPEAAPTEPVPETNASAQATSDAGEGASEPADQGSGARTAVGDRPDFSAKLENFSGPLDLLLYLIKENEVEITDIPIAPILQQYVAYLDRAAQWDLPQAGEFLVMATTLMEIKSRELLPVQEELDPDEIIEDPRSELVRQLLRYRRLKDQARELEQAADFARRQRPRGWYDEVPEAPEEIEAREQVTVDFDLYELYSAFERLQRSVLAAVPRAVHYEGETMEEKLARIEGILQERPFARFAELVRDPGSRADIAMTFVALLELVRRRMIRLLQDRDYSELSVKVQTQEEAEALARNEAAEADQVVDLAMRERAEREARLLEAAQEAGVAVEKLPWKQRRALMAKQKFEGLVRAEDLEEIDAEDAEIARRIDAILAAADVISQRFEDHRAAQSQGAPGEPGGEGDAERPVTEDDLAPVPEGPPGEDAGDAQTDAFEDPGHDSPEDEAELEDEEPDGGESDEAEAELDDLPVDEGEDGDIFQPEDDEDNEGSEGDNGGEDPEPEDDKDDAGATPA